MILLRASRLSQWTFPTLISPAVASSDYQVFLILLVSVYLVSGPLFSKSFVLLVINPGLWGKSLCSQFFSSLALD